MSGIGASAAGSCGALAEMFELSSDEGAALGRMLHAAAAAKGLDAERLVAGLDAGRSIGAALGMPEGLGETLYARAHRWFEAGRPERAEPLFRALCALDGGVADYWVGHAVCLQHLDRFELAEIAVTTAVRLRPDWDLPFLHLAEILARRGRIDAATRALGAFDARRSASTPESLVGEATRLREVLAAHGAKNGRASTGSGIAG